MSNEIEILSEGEFLLTYCQAIILNKNLNSGYKIELKENINKNNEDIMKFKPASKKQKTSLKDYKITKESDYDDRDEDSIKERERDRESLEIKKYKKHKDNYMNMNTSTNNNSSKANKLQIELHSMPPSKEFKESSFKDSKDKESKEKDNYKESNNFTVSFKESNKDIGSDALSNDNISNTYSGQNPNNSSHLPKKRSLREKKATVIEDIGYIDKDKPARLSKNVISAEIFKKCEKVFSKLKRHQLSSEFLSHSNPEVPTLNLVEKSLRSYTYQSVYQFGMDIRKIWNYYFSNCSDNTEIYQKSFAMSNYFEMIFKEIENTNDEKSDIQELHKKVEKLSKEIKEFHGKTTQPIMLKKNDSRGPVNIMDKPMSISEKNALGNNIRLLTPDQLKGIISILSESMEVSQNNKFFEFDIEILPSRKLRELEKYVKQCLKSKGLGMNMNIVTPKSNKNSNLINTGNENINQLKEDLNNNIRGNGYGGHYNTHNVVTSGQFSRQSSTNPIELKNQQSELMKKSILSDSDSLSSSEDSDSESLSSIKLEKMDNRKNRGYIENK